MYGVKIVARLNPTNRMGYAPERGTPVAPVVGNSHVQHALHVVYPNASSGILGQAPSNGPPYAFGPTGVPRAVAQPSYTWGPHVVYGPYVDQATTLSQAFNAMTVQDFGDSSWYMDTGATSHLASNACKLTSISNNSILSSILVCN
ncbi:hypothetical protein Tco_0451996, partial [Tanacetum coccineum]